MQFMGKGLAIAASVAAVSAVIFSLVTQSAAPASAAGPDTPGRLAGKPDFNGIWEAINTANWDLQTHQARPMVGQPGLTPGSMVLAAPVVALGSLGWVPGGLGVVEGEGASNQSSPEEKLKKVEPLKAGEKDLFRIGISKDDIPKNPKFKSYTLKIVEVK